MNLRHELVGFLVMGMGLAGCAGNDEPEWQYDQADMEAAVFGTWSGTITPIDEEAAPLSVTIRSHDEVARSPACGDRNFSVDEATPGLGARCITASSLALSATVAGDDSESGEADGSFIVYGETFGDGDLWLDYRSSASRYLLAYYRDGVWSDCEIRDSVSSNEGIAATCTLDERVVE